MSAAAILLFARSAAAQSTGAAPFRARGEGVEARRSVLQARIQALRTAVRDSLQANASDLLPTLDPAPPPVHRGYRLLPRIIGDAPQSATDGPIVTVYSWAWTDSLIAEARLRADSISARTHRARDRADYVRVVADFNALVAHRRLIDSHVEHNWQWQAAIAADTPRFAATLMTIDSVVARRLVTADGRPAMSPFSIGIDSSRDSVALRVPIVTDIEDARFLLALRNAVEAQWRMAIGPRWHRVVLDIRTMTPRDLYCAPRAAPCAPPADGAAIDVAAHVARFPAGAAVLTTGAAQAQVVGGRAFVLGPRDVAPRTLAHEFGHLLGFDDAYLRGGRNLGADGFEIVELVPNRQDVMASPGFGSVLPRHFEQLEDNVKADGAMRAGLAAMYERGDAPTAVRLFRAVLGHRPDHYGATFQLAKSLDRSGDSTTATIVWKRMLDMAIAQHDEATVKTVRSRLGIP
jgi:hypothetical protein